MSKEKKSGREMGQNRKIKKKKEVVSLSHITFPRFPQHLKKRPRPTTTPTKIHCLLGFLA